jgi:hypothetical protein
MNTYDLKNGSPKLQLNSAPVVGGSVATIFGLHSLAPLAEETKSAGLTGNILPPIWKAISCGIEHGMIGVLVLVVLEDEDELAKDEEDDADCWLTLWSIICTTSLGPRRSEFPYVRG